jgi:PAS domain S-box-containing protein
MFVRALVFTLLATLLAAILARSAPLLDSRLTDLFFILRGPRAVRAPVVIVNLPPEAPGEANPWGASLADLARTIRLVSGAGPSCIVLSMTRLTLVPPRAPGLADLSAALKASRSTVLPACLAAPGQGPPTGATAARFSLGPGDLARPPSLGNAVLATPPDGLVASAAGLGSTNLYPDLDGVVRAFPMVVSDGDSLYPSLPLEAARVAASLAPADVRLDRGSVLLGNTRIPVSPDSAEVLIDYPGGTGSEAVIDAADLAHSTPDERGYRLRDRVVVVTATGIAGSNLYPTSAGPPAYGAEIVAATIENLIARRPLRTLPQPAVWALSLLLALACMFLAQRLKLALALVADLALVALVPVGLAHALGRGLFIPAMCPLMAVLLAAIGNIALAGAAAERRQVEDSVRFQSRLGVLEHIGDLLGTAFDRVELLRAIMRWVGAELQAEASSVMLLDRDQSALRFEVALGPDADAVQDFLIPLGHGIAGRVAQTGDPIIANDVANDPRHAREISGAVGAQPRNLLCVPMRLRGEVVGVLEAMDKTGGADFDLQDQALLSTIAQQAALLLENSRLYNELQQRVDFANAELRVAYRDLSSEKAKVDTLIDQLPSPIIATDADNTIVLLNRAAEEMLGVTEAATVGKSVSAVIPVTQIPALFAADLSATGHLIEELEIEGATRRIFRVSLALVRGPDAELIGKSLVMIDITELRELDAMKTDLISFVAHELRNPLGIISGFARLAGRRVASDRTEEVLDLIGRIDRQTRRMEHLVDDFLNISRLEAGRPLEYRFATVHNVADMIRQVVELEPRRTDSHRLSDSLPDDLPPLRADPDKLEQVFTNLVGNAVKYSPAGGNIEVSAAIDGELVRFAVSDQGLGIPPDQKDTLFGKFRRLRGGQHERLPGTGLGLYLSKQLVEGHGGRMWVESEVGRGTTFFFTIPIASPEDGEPDAA